MIPILIAILPSLVLMFIIYKQDKIEPEPPGLLVKLFFFGVISVFPAMVLELLLDFPITLAFGRIPLLYLLVENFIGVALVEEVCKLFFLKLGSWKSPHFNYRFDGMVYAVFVSLGFAAIENVFYLVSYGAGVLFMRALLSIPAHLGFSVFMGTYYGTAKIYDAYGSPKQAFHYRMIGLLIATLLHGFYDFTASIDNGFITLVFFAFVIIMDILLIIRVRSDSKNDRLIHY